MFRRLIDQWVLLGGFVHSGGSPPVPVRKLEDVYCSQCAGSFDDSNDPLRCKLCDAPYHAACVATGGKGKGSKAKGGKVAKEGEFRCANPDACGCCCDACRSGSVTGHDCAKHAQTLKVNSGFSSRAKAATEPKPKAKKAKKTAGPPTKARAAPTAAPPPLPTPVPVPDETSPGAAVATVRRVAAMPSPQPKPQHSQAPPKPQAPVTFEEHPAEHPWNVALNTLNTIAGPEADRADLKRLLQSCNGDMNSALDRHMQRAERKRKASALRETSAVAGSGGGDQHGLHATPSPQAQPAPARSSAQGRAAPQPKLKANARAAPAPPAAASRPLALGERALPSAPPPPVRMARTLASARAAAEGAAVAAAAAAAGVVEGQHVQAPSPRPRASIFGKGGRAIAESGPHSAMVGHRPRPPPRPPP